MNPLKSLSPASSNAHDIVHLWYVAGAFFAVIFFAVCGLIVLSLMKYRWREGEPDPEQVPGNKTVELVWTGIPFLIVLILFFFTIKTMGTSDPPPPPHPDIVVTGHQWWWEAQYPKSGVTVANEIHIPVGKELAIELESGDVLHEFWVARLTRKMTTVPGHPNHIWLEADEPGTYLGSCSEFCGTEHAWMRFLVIAQTPADFAAWEQAQSQKSVAPTTAQALQGEQIFMQMSCVNCHNINGTDAHAHVGPDLTHLASRRQLCSGLMENTPENLDRWLRNPQEVKPGVLMPNFEFTPDQVTDLAAYLETLR
ncbi:MAG TPA: cytochrome c oxidase subunit II [Chthoniobacteraceae bacterium]|nr:cytochrome c oxidase subunit II [Chthoniobacteraceae bacterium]